jgi:branched-chain amino acid transport system permease protein
MRTLALVVLVVATLPLLGSGYLMSLGIIIALHGLPAIGLALLTGYTGQISIGHAAFYGLGAYGSALLTLRAGLSPWAALAMTAASVGLLAGLLGRLIFRLRGHHLAVATLGLGIIVHVALIELREWTGGPNGLSGIPPLSLLGVPLDRDVRVYPLAWAACLAGALAARNLVGSPAGLVMRGVRESERAAASLGTDIASVKRAILALSAVFAAVGGALYAHYVGYVSPQPFGVVFSIRLIVMVALGGFTSVWGVLLATAFVTVLGELLGALGHADVMVFGLMLVLVMVFAPDGLGSLAGRVRRRARAVERLT